MACFACCYFVKREGLAKIMTEEQRDAVKRKVKQLYENAGIVLSSAEKENIEVSDMGLNDIEHVGIQIVTYVNTRRVCAKEIAMLPGQTCPEHRHPPLGKDNPGKEETFRCRYGRVYLYVEGESAETIDAAVPKEGVFTVFNQIILRPGDQYTLNPNILHWFQAGGVGAVISEFSTRSTDEFDVFSDSRIIR